MADYQAPEASKVVLTPIDAKGLHSLGCIVTAEEIILRRDEKQELFGMELHEGQPVKIDYIIGGHKTYVVYEVRDIKPPVAYVGRGTTVIINSEGLETAVKQNGQLTLEERVQLRRTLQARIELLQKDVGLCIQYGLDPSNLVAELNSRKEYLREFW